MCLHGCPLSHLLRKCQLSQRESREAGANFFLLRAVQTCLSLWERCRGATERAGSLVRELDCRFAARLREFVRLADTHEICSKVHLLACLPSQSFASQMSALPKGEPRRRSEPHTYRIRLSLAQICSRAAPSVTACAVPPSSKRKALVLRAVQLVSPSGRDVAQRQRGQAPL